MQVLSYETYYLALIIFIVILFIVFFINFVSLRASKLYLSMQNAIHGDKTYGQ